MADILNMFPAMFHVKFYNIEYKYNIKNPKESKISKQPLVAKISKMRQMFDF